MRISDVYLGALRIRMIEQAIARNYSPSGGEQKMRCPIHLSIGQELLAAAFCSQLATSDKLFSTHRCHAHYLAKGGSLKRMLAELHGRVDGCAGGRGGSMHLFDIAVGMIASIPIVASAIPLAVGAALSSKIDGTSDVSAVIFGDACLEEGVTHESMNYASLNKLPVIFLCENNLYSVYTKLADRQPNRDLMTIGQAHSVNSYRCDGNNVEQMLEVFSYAINGAKSGDGPAFVVVDTYRWLEHCGPNYDNHIGYRTPEEFELWRARDGLELLERKLIEEHILDKASVEQAIKDIATEIDDAFQFSLESPYPKPEFASRYVYA